MVCPLQPCGACSELATKPTPQNFLHLIHRRHYIESNLNLWHDQLAARLPVEIVSQIFVAFDQVNEPEGVEPGTVHRRHWEHSLQTPSLLSRVCRRWRNIVLTTPQLWTKLLVKVRIHARPEKLELFKEFLARSGSLPLSLMLWGIDIDNQAILYPLDPLVDVVKSCSSRWKFLDIENLSQTLASDLLRDLDYSVLEGLRMKNLFHLELIHLHEPLRPKHLSIQRMERVATVPLKWDNITHLEVSDVDISRLLYIVKQTPRLTNWRSEMVNIDIEDQEHPFPDKAIVNPILKHLEISFKENSGPFFHHLALPGLTHLQCHFGLELYSNDQDLELEDLIDFLARSQLDSKSLQTLDLKYNLLSADYDHRFRDLKAITHLRIFVVDEQDTVINSYLSAIHDISILPHLRELQIEAWNFPSSSFTILCDALREKPLLAGDGSVHPSDGIRAVRHFQRHPLEYVAVDVYDDAMPIIPREDYFFFRSIQSAGSVKLAFKVISFPQVFEIDDILQSMAQVYGDSP